MADPLEGSSPPVSKIALEVGVTVESHPADSLYHTVVELSFVHISTSPWLEQSLHDKFSESVHGTFKPKSVVIC